VRPSLRGWMQGYNGQAVVNEHQMILAAEVETVGADFGDLEPMLNAAQRELAAAGVPDTPEVLLADAGCWHGEQMERIVDRGNPGAHPARHQPSPRDAPQLGRRPLRLHAKGARHRARRRSLPQASADDRAGVRADEVQPRPRSLQTKRPRRRAHRMAAHHGDAQPPQAPPTRPRGRLRRPRRAGAHAGRISPPRHRPAPRQTSATAKSGGESGLGRAPSVAFHGDARVRWRCRRTVARARSDSAAIEYRTIAGRRKQPRGATIRSWRISRVQRLSSCRPIQRSVMWSSPDPGRAGRRRSSPTGTSL